MEERENIKTVAPSEVLKGRDLTIDLRNVKKEFSFGKFLDRKDVVSLLAKIPSHKAKHFMFFQVLWRQGLRVTEAINLTKGQINFDDDMITIRWLKSRKYQKRVMPLNKTLKNPLYLYCASLKADEQLFPFSRQRADQLAKKYGFGHCHVLRHSFAVNFIKQNKNAWALSVLQKLLGHSNIRTTMKYLEAMPVDQARALDEVIFD